MRYRRWPTIAQWLGGVFFILVIWRLTLRETEPQPLPAEGIELRVERAVDGDTLLMDGGYRVRLFGVDTPETKHPHKPPEAWGAEAFEYTRQRVEGKIVRLEFDRERRDDYGRWLAYVFVDDVLLNEELIRQGFSEAETRFPFRGDRQRLFEQAEERAREEKLGIWSDRSGGN